MSRRFVILRHEAGPRSRADLHWDFMLEASGALRSWALPETLVAGRPQVAEALADHRLDYLTYEGPVSGERGHVTRQEQGTAAIVEERDGWLLLEVRGQTLRGRLTIELLPNDDGSGRLPESGAILHGSLSRDTQMPAPQRWRFSLSTEGSPAATG